MSLSRASRLEAMLLCLKLCQKISEWNCLFAYSVVSESSPTLYNGKIKLNKNRSKSIGHGNFASLDFLRLADHCVFS